jgi:MFS family permease
MGAVFGFAFIIGPVLAGTLLHYFAWNVLFLINIPIAIGIVLFAIKILPNTKIDKPGKFDWKGIVSIGLMLGLFTYGMSNLDSDDFLGSLVSSQVLPYLILTIVFFLTTLFIERRAEAPVVKTTLFYNRQIRLVAFVAIATGILQSSFVFIPNFAVGLFDVSPSTASFMLLPVVLATAFGSPLFGRIMDYTGSKMVIILGLGLDIIGFYLLSSVGNHKVLFYTAGAFIGLGLSILSGSSLRYIMLNEAEKADRAVTQGMLTIFVSIGQLTGAALIGVIIAQSSGVSGYNAVFLYQAILLVVVALASFRFKGKEAERLTVAEG